MARKPLSRSGRFSGGPDPEVSAYSESVSYDRALAPHDLAGSIAHATMLAKSGLIPARDGARIVSGLRRLAREVKEGRFAWDPVLEDVHMNLEAALTRRVSAGARLHTARSRNDQVATGLRLWTRETCAGLGAAIAQLQAALVRLADRARLSRPSAGLPRGHLLPMPGYTHLQRAQPILAAHHVLAYVEMLERDRARFADCARRAGECPLGAGALAGTGLRIRRALTARLLGFRAPSANSMDAVSDRDFAAEFLFAAALTGVHLSRLAEDLILWSTVEFGFLALPESHTTGSSLMPQKRNPDVAELGRGKTGRLVGNLVALLTVLKGLPLAYNRDLQEDKEPLFDSARTLAATLSVFRGMLDGARFRPEACLRALADPSMLATELAEELVRRGTPFRAAHHAAGAAVRLAEERGVPLDRLSAADWRKAHPLFPSCAKTALDLRRALQRRDAVEGAPGPRQVEARLRVWRRRRAR
ncbi:MAG: argininosuccinate lyase [Verrucomicrobiae bacterium]|nr:argininosuccinate lyase [Verrucomicrobiae bacterium]